MAALVAWSLGARPWNEALPVRCGAWRLEVPSGTSIEVENSYGQVHVDAVEGAHFAGKAVCEPSPGPTRPLALEPRCQDGRCRVAVQPPGASDGGAQSEVRRPVVDLTVEVPASSPLAVRTAGGPLQAALGAPRWQGPVELATQTGPVQLTVPSQADLTIEIDTQGAIATDVSMAVERVGFLRKRARARLGAGSVGVRLTSHQGDVTLRLAERPPSAAPRPAIEDWSIERLERTAPLAPGGAVEVENLHGDLRVRPNDRPEIWLVAQAQRHREDPRAAELSFGEADEGGTISVRVIEPAPEPGTPADWSLRRVDITLLVPPATGLAARTDAGLIEIKGLQGPVQARSQGGDLRLWVGGPVDLRTEMGSIAVVFLGTGWSHASRLETAQGSLTASFSPGADADLDLVGRGPVTSDFTIDLERLSSARRHGRVRLGRGGPIVELTSEEGSVSVLQLPESADR